MSYNNRNQLNPNVWDIRSNNQSFNGQQQQIPSLLQNTFYQQPINNHNLMNPVNFYNSSPQNYQQPQSVGLMFNNNDQSSFNQRKYNNNTNRPNRPGPAFSKRNPAWENDVSNNSPFDNYSRDSREYDIRQHERQEPSSGLNIGSTLERLKKKPTSVDPVEVSNKLLTKLKTMPKSDVKDLINNPKQQFRKTVLNIQAKQNIREQNRQKLRTLGNEGDIGDLEVDEAIDCRELPGFLNDLTKADSDTRSDENIEVVQKNLGTDFLSGSEMLLMTGFSLLGDNDEQPQFEVPEVPPLPTEKQRPPLPQDNISAKPTPVPAPDNSIKSDKERFNFISFYQSPRDWEQEVEKSKNPDPPPAPKNQEKVQKTSDSHKIVSIQVCDYAVGLRPMYSPNCEQIKNKIEVALPSLAKSPVTVISEKVISPVQTISKTLKPQSPFCSGTPKSTSSHSDIKQPETPRENNSEPLEKRNQSHQQESLEVVTEPPVIAKMTYGDHKRKLAEEHHKQNDDRRSAIEEPTPDISLPTPPPQKKQKGPQSNQNTSRDRNWTNNRWVRNEHNNQQRNQNNTNNNNNRKSRIDMDRDNDRDRDRDRRWSNAFSDRSISNNRDKEMSDVHTQRANNDTASTSNPFNRKNHERIPVNQSPVRDFAESSYVPANDFRPCYYTLKKIMDMDAEITKVHEKIHTLDIIIQGHHSERVIHQKAFNKLQHDRKVLFDNLMKRASTSEQRSKSSETRDVSASSAKQDKEKKSQPYVDDRKKKQDEIYKKILDAKSAEEHAESVIEKQKSEKEKAARLQKEREKREQEERDLKKLIEERKRKKLQRIKRQEDEKLRLERRICQEEVIKITTIKSEPRESSNDRQKSTDRQKSIESQKSVDRSSSKTNDRQKSVDRQKPVAEKSTEKLNATNEKIFRHETLNIENFTVRECSVKLDKLEIPQNKIDIFLSEGVTEIDSIDDVAMKPIIADESIEKILPDNEEDENDEAIDNLPPMTSEKELLENQSLTELASDDQEYKEWTGNFNSHTSAIVDLQVADGKFLLAACEDGKVLKYNIHDGSLVAEFHEHKEICNAILYDNSKFVYSVSSDGYLNQINFETFDLKSFEDFREALQVIEKSKTSIFVGSKNGNIYRLQHDLIVKPDVALCEVGAMVLCIKTWREGSRNVLLVSSKSQAIQIRDADDGLLLRIINETHMNLTVFDLLIDGGTVYCGNNGSEIHAIDFTNGALKKSHACGKGTICLKMYKNYLIAACYDGNIYVFNTTNDEIMNICGPSTVQLLAMDLWEDKIVATTNDKTLKIIKIPF